MRIRPILIGASAALAMSVAVPTAAQASEKSWTWEHANGNNIGHASYVDKGNRVYVDDQDKDGRSVLLYIRNPKNGKWATCWDHGGAKGPGIYCPLGSYYKENARVKAKLCRGEWSKVPSRGKITSCSSTVKYFYI